MKEDYLKNINQILFKIGKDSVSLENDLDKEGILDSIEIVDFFVSLEKEYGLKISQDQIYGDGLTKISTLVSYLESKTK